MTESVFYNNHIYSNKETSLELHFDTVFSSRALQTETKVNMNAAAFRIFFFLPAFFLLFLGGWGWGALTHPGGPHLPKMKSNQLSPSAVPVSNSVYSKKI